MPAVTARWQRANTLRDVRDMLRVKVAIKRLGNGRSRERFGGQAACAETRWQQRCTDHTDFTNAKRAAKVFKQPLGIIDRIPMQVQ